MQSEPVPYVSYLAFHFPSPERFIVGLLTLDKAGFPLDFRFSSPVQPTPMQKALYGASLEPWLMQSIVTELFKELPNDPEFVITNHREIKPEWITVPMVLLEHNQPPKLMSAEPSLDIQALVSAFAMEVHEPFRRIEQALSLIPAAK